ncbi:hypothetical protein [Desulfovibrio inopinatus]|uniref:hypothetical protein n=1 Tax=Desulfovibrio inopinatus TaxID=102109 RepID=UPI0004148F55|nr:hypothetical protein [Desulfovibrio inopinatus]
MMRKVFGCTMMFVFLVMAGQSAVAQTSRPGIKESLAEFIVYANESLVQFGKAQERIHEFQPESMMFHYLDFLSGQLEKTVYIALNLHDLFYIYEKAEYCFTVDERRYITRRINTILNSLDKIIMNMKDSEGVFDKQGMTPDEHKNMDTIIERMEGFRDFVANAMFIFE